MKNLTLLAIALLLAGPIFAQPGLELTVGYTPGMSFVLNDDDFAAGRELNYQVTYGSQIGLTLGFNFSERLGLTTGLGLASINQNYITDYDGRTKEEQDRGYRRTTYIRVPLMLRLGGDPTAPTSAFFRFGPHLDFLAGANGYAESSFGPITASQSYNYRNMEKPFSNDKYEVFENTVIGLTMEVGGRVRISDAMGLLFLFHLESSLTNPEGADANVFFTSNSAGERAPSWNIMPGINVSFQYVLNFE